MIPTIGLMIGMYILTRMAQIASRRGERVEVVGVRILALMTILVDMIGMWSLLSGPASSGR